MSTFGVLQLSAAACQDIFSCAAWAGGRIAASFTMVEHEVRDKTSKLLGRMISHIQGVLLLEIGQGKGHS